MRQQLRKWLPLAAALAALAACENDGTDSGGTLDPPAYDGAYVGTWTNTTFGSQGTGSATIDVNTETNTATVTATASGNVLGVGGVTPQTRSGTFTASGATFTGNVPPMGNITGTIDDEGNITASGTNVPNTAIQRWDATGTITASQIRLNFTVTFTSGSPATGSITLNKQQGGPEARR
jgi:hypothetical protein